MTLRTATSDDLPLLRQWGCEAEFASPSQREQLIAEEDGRPIGFIRINDPTRADSSKWGCLTEEQRAIDIWIGEAVNLDDGYGRAIMKLAIQLCFADPTVTAVLVDPPVNNPRAQRFFERLGFEYVARRRFEEDDCFVYRLNRPNGAGPPCDTSFTTSC